MLGNDIVLCIVGNKIDLEKDRHVSSAAAEEYARSVNAKLYHTSAKSNRGIEDLFNDLAMRKFERRKTGSRRSFSSRDAGKNACQWERDKQCKWNSIATRRHSNPISTERQSNGRKNRWILLLVPLFPINISTIFFHAITFYSFLL